MLLLTYVQFVYVYSKQFNSKQDTSLQHYGMIKTKKIEMLLRTYRFCKKDSQVKAYIRTIASRQKRKKHIKHCILKLDGTGGTQCLLI